MSGLRVSAGFFAVLGVKPFLGRTFLPEEEVGVDADLGQAGRHVRHERGRAAQIGVGAARQVQGGEDGRGQPPSGW